MLYNINLYFNENSSLLTPQIGQANVSGKSSNFVPAGIPSDGNPFSSSYSHPQMLHAYFLKLESFVSPIFSNNDW